MNLLDTRASPSRCLGFIQRWQKMWENAPHVADLHYHTNPMVYHMSLLVQSPQRRCVTKLTEILLSPLIYTSSISSQVRWLRNWLPVIKIIFRELQQILSKSIAYYVKIKFQSQLDFDCTKPFKAIRSALNVKIVVEIQLAPKLPFLINCGFLTIFLHLLNN